MPPPRLMVGLGLYALKWHLSRMGRRDLLAPTLDATIANWARIHAECGLSRCPTRPGGTRPGSSATRGS